MSTTIDGQKLFDELELKIEIGSYKRDTIEKAAPMLDGIISINLGRRSRKIKQTGMLRAKSRTSLDNRILAISNLSDGDTHTLVTEASQYENLRMDSFRIKSKKIDGTSIVAGYEIIYTQLV